MHCNTLELFLQTKCQNNFKDFIIKNIKLYPQKGKVTIPFRSIKCTHSVLKKDVKTLSDAGNK